MNAIFNNENLPWAGKPSIYRAQHEPHRCLDYLLQDLGKHEGLGEALVAAALRSPVVRNRNLAIRVLEAWDLSSWGERLESEVIRLSGIEPDDSVRDNLANLRAAKGI